MVTARDFDAVDLAAQIESMSPAEIDALPFGVIGLDEQGCVRVYSATEARQSGYGARPALGRMFFEDVAPCMNNPTFKGRIEDMRRKGLLSIRFTFVGDFSDRHRAFTVRIVSASDGGVWIFHQR